MPGQIGCKSIEIDASRIGCKSIEIDASQMPLTGNVISMNLHPIRPVKLGGNSLRLHCMPAWLNLLVIISMDLHPN